MSSSDKAYDAHRRLDLLVAKVGGGAADPWHDVGSMTSGWSKATGTFKYRLILPGVVAIAAQTLQCTGATTADTTTILSAANGLPSGYQPSTNKLLAAFCDVLRIVGSNSEAAALRFANDGHVECQGIAAGATTVSCFGLLFIDI